jgi:Arc/MetJ-type ribon-helix-helix transcriptional regulator
MMSDQVRLPVTLPRALHEWLRQVAFRERRSMAELIREALAEYRDRREPQMELPIATPDG